MHNSATKLYLQVHPCPTETGYKPATPTSLQTASTYPSQPPATTKATFLSAEVIVDVLRDTARRNLMFSQHL